MKTIKILQQNKYYLVVYKPNGWTIYKESGVDLNCIDFFKKRNQNLYPVHRLDRATCGLVVFAKDAQAAARLSKIFASNQLKKKYVALVEGVPPLKGSFHNPLQKKGEASKSALTQFKKLKTYGAPPDFVSLVELIPKTGRFHQLRKHLSMNGYPIVGDSLYGREGERLMLSAVGLAFVDPWLRREVQFKTEAGFLPFLNYYEKRQRT